MKLTLSSADQKSILIGLKATATLDDCGCQPYVGTTFTATADFDHLTRVYETTNSVALGILRQFALRHYPNVPPKQWKWWIADQVARSMASISCNFLSDQFVYRGRDLPSETEVRHRMHSMMRIAGIVVAVGLSVLAIQSRALALLTFATMTAAKELSFRLLSASAHERCMDLTTWIPFGLDLATSPLEAIGSVLIFQALELEIFQKKLLLLQESYDKLKDQVWQFASQILNATPNEGPVKQLQSEVSRLKWKKMEVRNRALERAHLE